MKSSKILINLKLSAILNRLQRATAMPGLRRLEAERQQSGYLETQEPKVSVRDEWIEESQDNRHFKIPALSEFTDFYVKQIKENSSQSKNYAQDRK